MVCKICQSPSKKLFKLKVLYKYDVDYFQCPSCLFIQTEEPYWLDEAYSRVISFSDIGVVLRGIYFSEIVTALFGILGIDRSRRFLDHGGGHGMFVRAMRDNGYNFYWADKYCENIYATLFKAEDLPSPDQRYEATTAFEVFEHLTDPMQEISELLAHSDTIIFSTELINRANTPNLENWWYLSTQNGQHIAIYHRQTLEYIARKFGINLYTYKNLHMLSRRKFNATKYKFGANFRLAKLYNSLIFPKSLTDQDHALYMQTSHKLFNKSGV